MVGESQHTLVFTQQAPYKYFILDYNQTYADPDPVYRRAGVSATVNEASPGRVDGLVHAELELTPLQATLESGAISAPLLAGN